MTKHILSVLMALLAYSCLDLALAVQKIALRLWARNRGLAGLMWVGATASTTASSLLLLYAVSLGSVAVVGALAGTGLAAVTIFSAVVLKERIGIKEIIGVGAILISPLIMAEFEGQAGAWVRLQRLTVFSSAIVTLYLLTILLFRRHRTALGPIVAGLAGTLSGLVLLYQKVSTTVAGRSVALTGHIGGTVTSPAFRGILEVLINPYALTWVLLSITSTVVLQFSYRHAETIRLVPVFAANTILVPVVAGMICFGEVLHGAQWVGVGLTLAGVALLTTPD